MQVLIYSRLKYVACAADLQIVIAFISTHPDNLNCP